MKAEDLREGSTVLPREPEATPDTRCKWCAVAFSHDPVFASGPEQFTFCSWRCGWAWGAAEKRRAKAQSGR
jgi:hypothetical protein